MAKLKVVAEIEPKGNFPVVSAPNVAVGNSTLDSVISGIDTDIGNKVDKVSGKGLSTNDYTTAEKNKLAGIADNANNYVHPTTSGNKHIPSGGSSGKILGWDSDGTAKWVDEPSKGTVTSVKVGSNSYSPSSGVVSLPAYPTTLPANGGTAANVSGTVAVANGGTGATSASAARTNLGLGAAATKAVTSDVTSGSGNLITSGGVYTALKSRDDVLRENIEKNLINLDSCVITSTFNGLTFSRSGNTLTVSCTGTQTSVQSIDITNMYVPVATDLRLLGCPSGGGNNTYLLDAVIGSSSISDSTDTGTGSIGVFQFNTMENAKLRIRVAAGCAFTNKEFKIMLCRPEVYQLDSSFANFNTALSWSGKKLSYTSKAGNTMEYTGMSFTVPSGQIYEFFVFDGAGAANPTGIGVCDSNTNYNSNSTIIAENMDAQSSYASNIRLWARQVSGITVPFNGDITYYVWVKRSTAAASNITLLIKRIF